MKQILKAIGLPLVLFSSVLFSCAKNKDVQNSIYIISGNGSGLQETPPNFSAGVSSLSGTYNANSNRLEYDIVWTGLSGPATAAHIHGPALPGMPAEVLYAIDVSINGNSGRASGGITLADSVETSLLQGKLYYNIHSAAFPAGEVRGQIAAVRDSSGH